MHIAVRGEVCLMERSSRYSLAKELFFQHRLKLQSQIALRWDSMHCSNNNFNYQNIQVCLTLSPLMGTFVWAEFVWFGYTTELFYIVFFTYPCNKTTDEIEWNSQLHLVLLQQIFIPAKEGNVCLSVGFITKLHRNYGLDFHTTWIEDVFRPKTYPINLHCGVRVGSR